MDNTYLIVFVAVLEWSVCGLIYYKCIVVVDHTEPVEEECGTAQYLGGGVYDWGELKTKTK